MLTIRLHPTGRAHKRQYRIVVAQKHRHVSKKYLANLGYYDPHTKALKVDTEEAKKYLLARVELSSSVKALFKKLSLVTD
jgi:small subunit ribosomal protein S16